MVSYITQHAFCQIHTSENMYEGQSVRTDSSVLRGDTSPHKVTVGPPNLMNTQEALRLGTETQYFFDTV